MGVLLRVCDPSGWRGGCASRKRDSCWQAPRNRRMVAPQGLIWSFGARSRTVRRDGSFELVLAPQGLSRLVQESAECFRRSGTELRFEATSLPKADLGHELGEARVGAQRVGHGINVQVHEAVNAFVIGEGQQAEGFVWFPQPHVD